jgi:hypothetical protein
MSKQINWRKANLAPKPKLSVVDEQEYRGNDAAARWLERNEKKRRPPPKTDGERA